MFRRPGLKKPDYMKSFIGSKHLCYLLIILMIGATTAFGQDSTKQNKPDTTADNFDIRTTSFYLPQSLPKLKYYQSVSILYVILPKDWTLDVINAPMLSYAGKFTLPAGFNVQASLVTLFISYRLLAGPFWNYSHDHYHIGLGYQVAFNYGFLTEFGYNTHLTIFEQQPSLTLGYSFRKVAVTLRGDLYWTSNITESQGGHTLPFSTSFLNGTSLSSTVEQRLWKNRIMSFGVKFYYVRYHIIAWPAFPVNQYRYWVPEFQLGLSF
ncbi:MAG: hypothetical protein C5B59_20295 [Bacteroidetes bacterium]|nr:MAG: hypothetical protein C5B59_20295 [Bacteroidota bacterium]